MAAEVATLLHEVWGLEETFKVRRGRKEEEHPLQLLMQADGVLPVRRNHYDSTGEVIEDLGYYFDCRCVTAGNPVMIDVVVGTTASTNQNRVTIDHRETDSRVWVSANKVFDRLIRITGAERGGLMRDTWMADADPPYLHREKLRTFPAGGASTG